MVQISFFQELYSIVHSLTNVVILLFFAVFGCDALIFQLEGLNST